MHSAPTSAWLITTEVSGNLTAFLVSNWWLFIFFVDKICTFLTYFHKKQQKHKVLVNNFQLLSFRKAKCILGYYKTSIHCLNWPLNSYLTYRFMIFRVFLEVLWWVRKWCGGPPKHQYFRIFFKVLKKVYQASTFCQLIWFL